LSGRLIGLAVLLATLLGIATLSIERFVRSRSIVAAQQAARDDARLISASLHSELEKFSLVPLVLARDPQVRSLLAGSGAEADPLDRRLEELASQTDAAAIYLMNSDGLTLAASNWRLDTSFVGSNYNFRPYFTGAFRNGSATQFALGTVSRKPGLYIAQRVMADGKPIGVVAVKVEFDEIEANWRAATEGVFVTDRDGIVLLASNPDWRFHSTIPGSEQGRDRTLDRNQFGTEALRPLEQVTGGVAGNPVAAPLLDTQQKIKLGGWTLHLLVNPTHRIDAAVANARFYLLLSLAIAGFLGAAALWVRRRREHRAQAAIDEKTQTLREQLNQANRLATLGQVSAGVGHEISQPLAAARVFAETGERLLADGRVDEAGANFRRIVELSDRIGRITTELRRFSRRDVTEPQTFPVGEAIDGALLLLRDRVQRLRATVQTPSDRDMGVLVRAEPVRLEQVLVNLLQNALDAAGESGTIDLSLEVGEKMCCLYVADDGPGLDPALRERLFQPFATTKPDGLGLGLVISRDIMRALGGDLTLEAADRKAAFLMRIPRA
jgi:two-component system C4-dicarboxylate transport sensor histidine kinase DctB